VSASSGGNSCGSIEDACKRNCPQNAMTGAFGNVFGQASVVNGVGTYNCACCGGGRVVGGLASDAAAEQVTLDKVPVGVWLTIVIFGGVMWTLRFLSKPPGAKKEAKKEEKTKIVDKLMEYAGLLSVKILDSDAGLGACRLFKAGSLGAFVFNAHPVLSVLFGDRKLKSKNVRAAELVFGICLSFALALAFGGAQFDGKQYVSCARNCGSSSCNLSSASSSTSSLGGSIDFDPKIGFITNAITKMFKPAIDGLLSNSMPQEGCAAPTGFLAKNASRIVGGASVLWLILGVVFLTTLSGESSVSTGTKLFVVGTITSSSLMIGWFLNDNVTAVISWYTAKSCGGAAGSAGKDVGVTGSATPPSDGDVELQSPAKGLRTSSSDVNDTVTNPMAAKEGDDNEQNPTAQL
jgi:hypothetical protein